MKLIVINHNSYFVLSSDSKNREQVLSKSRHIGKDDWARLSVFYGEKLNQTYTSSSDNFMVCNTNKHLARAILLEPFAPRGHMASSLSAFQKSEIMADKEEQVFAAANSVGSTIPSQLGLF